MPFGDATLGVDVVVVVALSFGTGAGDGLSTEGLPSSGSGMMRVRRVLR